MEEFVHWTSYFLILVCTTFCASTVLVSKNTFFSWNYKYAALMAMIFPLLCWADIKMSNSQNLSCLSCLFIYNSNVTVACGNGSKEETDIALLRETRTAQAAKHKIISSQFPHYLQSQLQFKINKEVVPS